MSMASFERGLLGELQEVTGNKKIRLKDLLEWRTTAMSSQEGEKILFLPKNKIWVAYREEI